MSSNEPFGTPKQRARLYYQELQRELCILQQGTLENLNEAALWVGTGEPAELLDGVYDTCHEPEPMRAHLAEVQAAYDHKFDEAKIAQHILLLLFEIGSMGKTFAEAFPQAPPLEQLILELMQFKDKK